MDRYRNRAMLYLAEVTLATGLMLLPVHHDLPLLTSMGLFLHLTTSLGMLPFQWRLNGMGPGSHSLFGIPNRVLVLLLIAVGGALMASWLFGQSTPAYIAGVVCMAAGIEELVT